MPKSKVRKKVQIRHQHEAILEQEHSNDSLESPRWLAPTMVGAFLGGLGWIVTYYISNTQYPIPGIGAWNMVVGFGFIAGGFTLATRWR
jgi:hypothetical protein